MKKIILVGSNGMLGTDLLQLLNDQGLVICPFSYPAFDFARPKDVSTILEALDFQVLINCSAYTQVDLAETNQKDAFLVNADGPGLLSQLCKKKNALLIHFSTDYVFDGAKQTPYLESDIVNPLGVYGESKLAGEMIIQASGCRYLILRTSWLFGANGPNFVKRMIELAQRRSELKVVNDQVGSPTYTKDLAHKTLELIRLNVSGIFHVTNQGYCSWAEFAKEIFYQNGLTTKVNPCLSVEYPTLAKRPHNSRLSGQKLLEMGIPLLRNWKEALNEYLNL